jgi:uncharacterized membrane protein YedE/YeeE
MSHFTPLSAAIGGLMIGAAVALLWVLNGRQAGISGIAGGLLAPERGETGWRLWFLAGLIGGGALLVRLHPAWFAFAQPESLLGLAGAGLLVGFGTRLGGGCTSGHGLCGVSRLSLRSLVATGVFMAAGMAAVFVARHLLGLGGAS